MLSLWILVSWRMLDRLVTVINQIITRFIPINPDTGF
uniref:Uncharacterized protein n=1 Tax=Arundo donax TaxID=35708 RepID=A0A0A9ABY6_ARUDO